MAAEKTAQIRAWRGSECLALAPASPPAQPSNRSEPEPEPDPEPGTDPEPEPEPEPGARIEQGRERGQQSAPR